MLKTRTAPDWSGILVACGVKMSTAARWAPAFSQLLRGNALSAGERELDDFLGQVLHECGRLESMRENMNYSVEGLIAGFGRHRISIADAQRYGRSPAHPADQEAIANTIYGGEYGKKFGNTVWGDGWRYRGGGPIHLTWKNNYIEVGDAIGVDLVSKPELIGTDPFVSLEATIRWWEKNLPDTIMDNLPAVTKRVNGGDKGIDERGQIQRAAQRALGVV